MESDLADEQQVSEPGKDPQYATLGDGFEPIAEDPALADAEAKDRAPGVHALIGGDAGADNREEIARDMLYDVIDPELGVDIVNLGLLRSVEIRGETADVKFTVTTPSCPLSSYIEDEIRSCLWGLTGIKYTEVECVYEPPWKPEDMTDLAKRQLGWGDF